eukprot:scaffold24_cov341-Pavlova_lutheri.AAC.23
MGRISCFPVWSIRILPMLSTTPFRSFPFPAAFDRVLTPRLPGSATFPMLSTLSQRSLHVLHLVLDAFVTRQFAMRMARFELENGPKHDTTSEYLTGGLTGSEGWGGKGRAQPTTVVGWSWRNGMEGVRTRHRGRRRRVEETRKEGSVLLRDSMP